MVSLVNDYQRPYVNQRTSTNSKTYCCVIYIDQPSKYSIVDSKRLTNIDENGRGFIKELNKSYEIRVEQTGSLQSMERYALLLEKAAESQMHDEVPSDSEVWQKTQKKQKKTCPPTSLSTGDRSPIIADQSNTTFSLVSTPSSLSSSKSKENSSPDTSLNDHSNDDADRCLQVVLSPSPREVVKSKKKIKSSNQSKENNPQDADYVVSDSSSDEESLSSLSSVDEDREKTTPLRNSTSSSITSSKKKKRSLESVEEITTAKRLRFSIDDDVEKEDERHHDLQQLFDYMKQLDGLMTKLSRQQDRTTIALSRQEKFMQVVCRNQKKIAKSLARHKVPISLDDDYQIGTTTDSESINANTTYTRSDGIVVELLKVFGTKQNTVKYALKLVDLIFVDKQEFQNIDVKKADEDPRIIAIFNAIKIKFNYSKDDMSIVWPQVHDCILSKRRNQQQRLKATSKKGTHTTNANSDMVDWHNDPNQTSRSDDDSR